MKICEKCSDKPSVNDRERFCKGCKKAILQEMKEQGYLTSIPYGHRSNHGAGPRCCSDASWDNAVKAIEDGGQDALDS